MAMTAREAAWTALQRWRKNGAWSDAALHAVLQNAQLEPRDAALAARICYGTLQNLTLLDHYLSVYCTTPLQKLEPKVLDLLRLSAYQIVLLDKIPPRAAVNEAVVLCRKGGCARASGLVNAVLRRVAEHRDALPEIPGVGTADYLAVRYSHPRWLVRRLLELLGPEEAEEYLRLDNEPVPTCIQTNFLKTDAPHLERELRGAGLNVQAHPWLAGCFLVTGTGDLEKLPAFREGRFMVQDAAARLVSLVAAPGVRSRVLDVCAAPGGKSFALAIDMQDGGEILSCDVYPHKLRLIESGAQRLGIGSVRALLADAREHHAAWDRQADLVVADVPCSGLGIIRKKPDIRYKNPRELAQLPALQRSILENAAGYVRPGGTLVYSTCTILPEENQDVTADFLRAHPDFALERFTLPQPIGPRAGQLTLWPQRFGTDGFYICRMHRNEA